QVGHMGRTPPLLVLCSTASPTAPHWPHTKDARCSRKSRRDITSVSCALASNPVIASSAAGRAAPLPGCVRDSGAALLHFGIARYKNAFALHRQRTMTPSSSGIDARLESQTANADTHRGHDRARAADIRSGAVFGPE